MKITGLDSEGLYRPLICSRCGETVLLKYIGTEYYDGGFSANYNFEKKPKGWKYHDTTGMLCPVCEQIYQSKLKMFMDYKEGEKNEDAND